MPGRLVDVGGFRLHLHCSGSGTPAVMMDAALGGSSISWSLIQPGIARADARLQLRSRRLRLERRRADAENGGSRGRRVVCAARARRRRAAVRARRPLVRRPGDADLRGAAPRATSRGSCSSIPRIPKTGSTPAPKEQIKIDRGIRLCRSGATAARFGAARVVSGLVTLGLFGVARGLAKVVSRGGLSREDEGILAPLWKLPPETRKPLRQFWTQEKFFDALGSQIASISTSAAETLDASAGRIRRPSAHHHLIDRPRRLPPAPAGRTCRVCPAAAATSSPRTAATGFRSTSRRPSSTPSAGIADARV